MFNFIRETGHKWAKYDRVQAGDADHTVCVGVSRSSVKSTLTRCASSLFALKAVLIDFWPLGTIKTTSENDIDIITLQSDYS